MPDEITEAIEDAVEEAVEEAVENVEVEVAPRTGGAAEAIRDVSLQEQLAECLQRIAVLEERQSRLSQEVVEAEVQAEEAEAVAEVALAVALAEPVEENSSNVQEVLPEPEVEEREPKTNFWEDLLACR